MADVDLSQTTAQLANQVLTWIGFGTLVGLLAKAIMPGRDPGGTVATLLMGISGSVTGCALLMYLGGGERIQPISPMGFAVGTVGSILLLVFYRLMSGYFFVEGGTARAPVAAPYFRRRAKRRPGAPVSDE